MTAVLEFNSVNKTFRHGRKSINALRDINLSIPEGEVFGFVGPNGAGKSTTIKVMLDIINDYTGEIHIYGVPAHRAESRRGIAYLPESPALYEQFTPREILHMALRQYGIRRRDEKIWIGQWLERLSLTPYADRRIRQLSKGNVQRTAIAHALVVQPRLLVLDEPLSGLDPVGRKEIIDLLLDYKHQGGAIFFTSHVLHDVERIADRFGFINQGELLTTRSPQELVSQKAGRMVVRYRCENGEINDGTPLREGEFEYEVAQTDLPAWLERLNQQNGRVMEIRPSESLESVFFQILDSLQTRQVAGEGNEQNG